MWNLKDKANETWQQKYCVTCHIIVLRTKPAISPQSAGTQQVAQCMRWALWQDVEIFCVALITKLLVLCWASEQPGQQKDSRALAQDHRGGRDREEHRAAESSPNLWSLLPPLHIRQDGTSFREAARTHSSASPNPPAPPPYKGEWGALGITAQTKGCCYSQWRTHSPLQK